MATMVLSYKHAVLDFIFGAGTNGLAPVTWYIGLFTVLPDDTGAGGTEPTGVGTYARVALTNNNTNFPAASSGIKKIGTVVTFPTLTVDIGNVVGVGIWTASTAGALRFKGAPNQTRLFLAGDIPRIDANTLTISFS